MKRITARLIVSIGLALALTLLVTLPLLAAMNATYQFEPDPDYQQTDVKARLKIYAGSGVTNPNSVIWLNPQGNSVSYCVTGGCGASYDQSVGDNGLLIWRAFNFYISGQQRPSGTYTAIVYQQGSELFRANFTISGNTPPTATPVTPTATPTPGPEVRCYVDAAATGTNDGTSWSNAFTDLQSALVSVTCNQVWVKRGVYRPTTLAADTAATFQLKYGVSLYGGFAGGETTLEQRDPSANPTILSGDIDHNDSQTPILIDLATVTGNSSNSRHVVTGASAAALDGFIITAGYASDYGGGMLMRNCDQTILTDVSFVGNAALESYGQGGGLYIDASYPRLNRVTFTGNAASADYGAGGAMYSYKSDPILTDITFSNNLATYGGGLYAYKGNPQLTNVTFAENLASGEAYAHWGIGGGMYNELSQPDLWNVTLSGNAADYGGGIYNNNPVVNLYSVTLSGNTATQSGGGLYNYYGSVVVRNSILWGNTAPDGAQIYDYTSWPDIAASVIQGGYSGGVGIITDDPFLGVLGDYGGAMHTLPLLENSSAIDAGNDIVCPALDQRGYLRPVDGDNDGVAVCDIGAFEAGSIPFVPPTPVPTQTNTPTVTHTFTPIPTSTSTPTQTLTPIPTSTSTSTQTLTPIPTNTSTPTATHTFTPIPTSTSTPTATHTFTPIPTSTYTVTPTHTLTAIPIPPLYFVYLPLVVK